MEFNAEKYHLIFPDDRPYVYLETEDGQRIADLFVLSSVHPVNGRDDAVQTSEWEVHSEGEAVIFSRKAESSVWRSKTYRFRCTPSRFVYEIEVEGAGALAEALYFGGYSSGCLRWGSGFCWSGQRFRRIFNPEPNTAEINYLSSKTSTDINLTGVPLPGKADWFFTPPPFCIAAELTDGWLGLGIEATPGANRYTQFTYHGWPSAFYLSLNYDGHTQVNGRYRLPAIGFDFAPTELDALAAHVLALRQAGYTPSCAASNSPAWWKSPIWCGWGCQCYLASLEKGRAPDYARQSHYERFLEALESNQVNPGSLVLDDKWQLTYGENCVDEQKWPDLPSFIACQHARGRKVLLWLKAWDPEGLPAEECVTNAAGLPIAADPTNPAYEHRLRNAVRRMLSPNGYDADGFKIDFTARIPSGPGLCTHADSWGLELMKGYLSILYTAAKRTKGDALILSHTPHPYLADVVDMIRLNDINTGKDVTRAMCHRAIVARIACPQALIDTDNWPMTDKNTWRTYVALQPELGIPSLYFATHIDSTGETLDAEDYRLLRETWEAYSARQVVL